MTRPSRTDLPPEQQAALKKAIRWEWITIGYTAMTITLVAFVVGNSQAMKTAWIEDMLSLIPQVAFLIALLFVRRAPSPSHPFGFHRAMVIGHLVAGVALLAVGGNLAVESTMGLVTAEHPTIGTVNLFGHTIWQGWLMIAVMVIIVPGPLIYGRMKLRIAPTLHNKLLYADADMAKADWHTNAASVIGVLGIGVGLWWLDSVAALFISLGIVFDGFRNTRAAVRDLIDESARTYDSAQPHPLIQEIIARMRRQPWVLDAGVRMRDLGHVFHVEVFFVPVKPRPVTVDVLRTAAEEIAQLDWKLQDVVVVPVDRLPDEATTAR